MFLSARCGILIINGQTQQDSNPAALALLDGPPEQVIGKSLFDITAFGDLPNIEQVFQQLAATGSAKFNEIRISLNADRATFVDIIFHSYLVSNERIIECNLEVVIARKRRTLRQRRAHTMAALTPMAAHVAPELNCLLPVISATSPAARGRPSFCVKTVCGAPSPNRGMRWI